MNKEEKNNNLTNLITGVLVTEIIRFIFKGIPKLIEIIRNERNQTETENERTVREVENDFSTNHDWNS